jgi:hypothetical protein
MPVNRTPAHSFKLLDQLRDAIRTRQRTFGAHVERRNLDLYLLVQLSPDVKAYLVRFLESGRE